MSPLTDGTRRDSTKSSSRHCRYLYHLHLAPGMVRCGLSGKEGCSRLRKQLGGPGHDIGLLPWQSPHWVI